MPPTSLPTLPILISGGFNCSNRGDWALCSSALESLTRCGLPTRALVQMFVPIHDPPIDETFEPAYVMTHWDQKVHKFGSLGSYQRYLKLQKRTMQRHLREVADTFRQWSPGATPIIWFTGGGYMNDVASHGKFTTRLGLAAIEEGYRVVLTGQTIGPFQDPAFERDAGDFLRRADWVGVRDEASLERMHKLGNLKRAPVRTHDNVFDMLPQTMTREQLRDRLRKRLGVTLPDRWVLMTFHKQDSTKIAPNIDAIEKTCRALKAEGVNVVVASFWGYAHEGDAAIASAVQRGGGTWVDHRVTTPEVRALASLADLMISTRLHGLVFAFAAGVPGVCLYAGQYYRDKSYGLAKEWGQAEWAIDIATQYHELPERAIKAWHEREAMLRSLAMHRDPKLSELDPVFDLFRQWAEERVPAAAAASRQ